MSTSIYQLLKNLSFYFSRRRKFQLLAITVLMVLVSLSEIINIGAVLPFLGVLVAPDRVFEYPLLQPLFLKLGIDSPDHLLLPISLMFAGAVIMTALLRLLLLWSSTKLSYMIGADLSRNIYQRTLYQPYSVHVARNSSEIINGISSKSSAVIIVLNHLMTLCGSLAMLFTVLITLLSIDPLIAFVVFGGFGLIYLFVIQLTRKRVLRDSERIARESTLVIKTLQEGLGGIRDVLLDGTQNEFCNIYSRADLNLRQAQGNNAFLGQFPRYGVEAIGILLIIFLAYHLASSSDGVVKAIPILGAIALGAQRFLPAFQQVYGSWTGIIGLRASLTDSLDLLAQPLPTVLNSDSVPALRFENQIQLKDVSFAYGAHLPYALKSINLTIKRGMRIGFIGKTGCGKSTLLDIVMALLEPSKGKMLVDDEEITTNNSRAWQKHVAHVPQYIFLADSSILENIAFGVPAELIDRDRVYLAAKQAQLHDLIIKWSQGYDTSVGERGIRLSGGQRQRIGIARALYKQANIIIFDEATSSLDNETEQSVMEAINQLSNELTLLIIAHRVTTLKRCDLIVSLENGTIKEIIQYDQIG
jgi:ABC-type multidrug transport system fused ATPase/permease subunit